MIKKYITLFASIACATSASAALLVSDGFDNSGGISDATLYNGSNEQIDGLNPTAAGIGWGGAWSTDTDDRWRGRSFGDLGYSDGSNSVTLVNPSGSAGLLKTSGGTGTDTLSRSFSSSYTGDLYFSFLANGNPGDSFRVALRGTNTNEGVFVRSSDDVNKTVVVNDINSGSGAVDTGIAWSSADFIIARVTNVGGGTDASTISLWINPSDLTSIESITASATFNSATIGNFSELNISGGADATNFEFDEFRLGQNFEDVTGITQVPEPSAFGLISGFLALGWVMIRRRS